MEYVHRTTVDLTQEELNFIRDRGMRMNRCVGMGIAAIKRSEELKQEISDMHRNIERMQAMIRQHVLNQVEGN